MAIPFRYNFEAYIINSLRFSESLILHISLSGLGYFSDKKLILKICGFKNVIERGIRKLLTFVIC